TPADNVVSPIAAMGGEFGLGMSMPTTVDPRRARICHAANRNVATNDRVPATARAVGVNCLAHPEHRYLAVSRIVSGVRMRKVRKCTGLIIHDNFSRRLNTRLPQLEGRCTPERFEP